MSNLNLKLVRSEAPESQTAAVTDLAQLKAQLQMLQSESFSWALACCKWDSCEAEDVLQAANIKVLDGRAQFQGRSSFKTWFFSVIRLTALETRRISWSRRVLLFRRWQVDQPVTELVHDPLHSNDQSENKQRIESALSQLSLRQREILELVFYRDLSIAQSARIMGVSLGTARTHYERGKVELHKRLNQNSAVAV